MKLFLALLLTVTVTAFQNEFESSEQESHEGSNLYPRFDFFQDVEADNAEFNFWSGALAIISRHDTQHRFWAHMFQDLVNASAYEQFGPPGTSTLSYYGWDSTFPSALHRIRWSSINPQWVGLQDNGYITALKSIPLFLHNAQCEAQANEIWTVIHYGRLAVTRRRVLDAYPEYADAGHINGTNALHEAVEQISNNLEYDGLGDPRGEFRGKTDSQNGTCRRVKENKCFDVKMCFEKNMTGDCFFEENSCAPSFSSYNINCRNLREEAVDKVTSVNTNGGCVVLYAFPDCRMETNRVLSPYTKGHSSLAEIGFDNEVQSWRPC